MVKKVLQLVQSCNDCPRKVYYSGGRSQCTEADTLLPHGEGDSIPDWCPLSAYPSDAMERQQERINDLDARLKAALPDDLKARLTAAADALKVFNGHDSGANLKHRYGDAWWDQITIIENGLREIVGRR